MQNQQRGCRISNNSKKHNPAQKQLQHLSAKVASANCAQNRQTATMLRKENPQAASATLAPARSISKPHQQTAVASSTIPSPRYPMFTSTLLTGKEWESATPGKSKRRKKATKMITMTREVIKMAETRPEDRKPTRMRQKKHQNSGKKH